MGRGVGVEVSSGLNRALTGVRNPRGPKGGSVQPTDKILQVRQKKKYALSPPAIVDTLVILGVHI